MFDKNEDWDPAVKIYIICLWFDRMLPFSCMRWSADSYRAVSFLQPGSSDEGEGEEGEEETPGLIMEVRGRFVTVQWSVSDKREDVGICQFNRVATPLASPCSRDGY